jgi:hypothetical protein
MMAVELPHDRSSRSISIMFLGGTIESASHTAHTISPQAWVRIRIKEDPIFVMLMGIHIETPSILIRFISLLQVN